MFLSLSVALPSFNESKSTVIPNGIPISSVREYLLPIEPLLSSTLWDTPDILRPVTITTITITPTITTTITTTIIYLLFQCVDQSVGHHLEAGQNS